MKYSLLAVTLLAGLSAPAFGQVMESVNFDTYTSPTNNDLANRFILGNYSAANIFTQVTTGGITGGAISPINEPDYGNDYTQYCSTYQNTIGLTTETTVSFKYNSTLVNPNSSARTVVINLASSAANEDLRFNLNRGSLQVSTYNYAQQTTLATGTFVSGHWYKVSAQYRPVGGQFNDQYTVRMELFDLGTAGTSAPVSKGFHAATIYRAAVVGASAYTAQIMGAKWGGAELLDNFTFSGNRAGSLCTTTLATVASTRATSMSVFPNPTTGNVAVGFPGGFAGQVYRVEVLDVLGKACPIAQGWDAGKQQLTLDASKLSAGLYIVNAQTSVGLLRQKLVVE
jgi:Secretion system C-terminal sorting domain